MITPKVSVVMPVFNAGKHLIDAVASIVEQTLNEWEMICIDDGSTDNSGALLEWCATRDARIRVVHQANAGIVAALNRGCELARAPLICRMDSDDIAIKDRLERQLKYLHSAPNCIAVGGAILQIDTEGDPLGYSRLPLEHARIVHFLLTRRTGLYHPTVMMRTEAFRAVGGYCPRYQWVEDHDLWLRLSQQGQLANMPDTLLFYRLHSSSVCWQRSQQRRELMNSLLREAYAQRNIELPEQFLTTSRLTRSPAGPGKWARAAASGGYPHSVLKHLRTLLHEPATSRIYYTRMVCDSLRRLFVAYPSRILSRSDPTVPIFSEWQSLAAKELVSAS